MSDRADRDRSVRQKSRLVIAGVLLSFCTALGSLGEALEIQELWIVSFAILTVAALPLGYFTVRDHRESLRREEARRREELEKEEAALIREEEERSAALRAAEHNRLRLLSTTRRGRERVPRFDELSAYELGTDPEASVADAPGRYLRRDRDDDLSDALAAAVRSPQPAMVVLRGPSKAGKSRTLFEAVKGDAALRKASVIAPNDLDALASMLQEEGPPALPPGRVLVWLDDLERFVAAGHRGMHRAALDEFAAWDRPVVVVATAGGKGAELLAVSDLSVPIDQLYNHPRVRVVPIASVLTPAEQARVGEHFAPDVTREVVAHGIGEYLVAAPELARKLEEERHRPGDEACPEGAAAAWAAIDWARSGLAISIPTNLLRELWPHYLRGMLPTEERFQRGLDWALRPIYKSVALVSETSSYEAYDWIVRHADHGLDRAINLPAWERMIDEAGPEAAFEIGVTAHAKGFDSGSRRAFTRGMEAEDPLVAARSAFNLGYLSAAARDTDAARAAYRRAIESGQREPAAKAAFNLGVLLEQHADLPGATGAYEKAIGFDQPPQSAMAAFNLGLLHSKRRDLEQARKAYEAAMATGDVDLAGRAAFALGNLLRDAGAVDDARRAYERAIAADHPELSAAAAFMLGEMLEQHRDSRGAREAFQRAAQFGNHPLAAMAKARLSPRDQQGRETGSGLSRLGDDADSPRAAFTLAVRLEEEGDTRGAQAAYRQAAESGHPDLAPAAAFNLAVLLTRQADPDSARTWYERAIESRHSTIASAAAFGLGSLLAKEGDPAGARVALRQAMASQDADVSGPATALFHDLS